MCNPAQVDGRMAAMARHGEVIGVVLAGGRSRRMGRDKATFEIGGRTMLDWVATALEGVCGEVVVAGLPEGANRRPRLTDPGLRFQGPLAGLVSGLRRLGEGKALVVAVDHPWVRTETLAALIEQGGELPLVPVDQGARQTTCALYPAAAVDPAAEELEAGGSIQSLLDRIAFDPVVEETWRGWGEDGRSWYSVDTEERAEEGLDRFGPPGS